MKTSINEQQTKPFGELFDMLKKDIIAQNEKRNKNFKSDFFKWVHGQLKNLNKITDNYLEMNTCYTSFLGIGDSISNIVATLQNGEWILVDASVAIEKPKKSNKKNKEKKSKEVSEDSTIQLLHQLPNSVQFALTEEAKNNAEMLQLII